MVENINLALEDKWGWTCKNTDEDDEKKALYIYFKEEQEFDSESSS